MLSSVREDKPLGGGQQLNGNWFQPIFFNRQVSLDVIDMVPFHYTMHIAL
jgi:hypothetical protein